MDTGTTTVGIFVFDDIELLDLAGPYEVFTTAARVNEREFPSAPPLFDVFTVARSSRQIRAHAGLRLRADHDFSSHPEIDLLVVPGGIVDQELAEPEVALWIASVAERSRIIASVCTGAFLLAAAGLLEGRSATTHREDIDDLRRMARSVKVVDNVRWVDEGAVVTAAGISAGIDMSLHLVERLAGRDLALATARYMEYDWTERS
jgi:transcriptional regulator GlxA family with amidase domain